jgi:hypothetical protein
MSRKYDEKERLAWLKSIYPDFQKKEWHDDLVYDPSDLKYYKFFKQGKYTRQKIDPSKIIGIEYAYSYNCPSLRRFGGGIINWIDLFSWLKRLDRVIDNFKTIEELTNHIHNDRDGKAVYKIGDHFFTTSGQHRLCLAKLIGLKEVEVLVITHKLDKEKLVRELKTEKAFDFYCENKMVDGKYDGMDQIKWDSISIRLNERHLSLKKKVQEEFIENYKNIRTNILSKIFYFLFFNNATDRFVSNSKEINDLKYLMYKHKYSLKYEKIKRQQVWQLLSFWN